MQTIDRSGGGNSGSRLRRWIPFRRRVAFLPVVLLLAALAAPAAAAPTPEEVFGTFIDILGQAVQQQGQAAASPVKGEGERRP